MSFLTRKKIILFITFILCHVLNAQPVPTRSGISIKQLAVVNGSSVRIEKDPVSGNLYILENNGNIKRVNFNDDSSSATFETVYEESDHGVSSLLGIAFGQDGTLYLVGNETNQQNTLYGTGIIVKGVPSTPGSEERTWSVLAQTVEYAYGRAYNHRMSGVIVDPDSNYIYVNSGARTDHGEEREVEGLRETGLTSIILKLPADGENIELQDDREWLRINGYLLAEGIRNDFDFAYSGNGDLFSVGNSGDRDDPEEMNWIREGHHYGFPWRIGGNRTPQQDTPYVPQEDPLLNPFAYGGGQGQLYITFSNDPDYPAPPDSITFTEPILSSGPVADKFRDTISGDVQDASELGAMISTFTPHRSPNGIVFDRDSILTGELKGGAFVISLAAGNTFQPFADTSQDLLHVSLTKEGDTAYTAQVNRLVSGFAAPLGIEMVGDKLYVVETGLWSRPQGNPPKLWEIDLSGETVGVEVNNFIPKKFELYQNYPNPFNPVTKIKYSLPKEVPVELKVYSILGREAATLVSSTQQPGVYEIDWNAAGFASGFYFYKIKAGDFISVKKLILLK